jgi:aspartokinase/homoserine dehydrogenase 1
VIENLSYKEALELAYFGASVLHPMTIAPALEKQIPIYIKNSYNPSKTGTLISSQLSAPQYLIKRITCIDKISLINIEGAGMVSVSGIAARIFEILNQVNTSITLISQASSEHSICFAISDRHTDTAMEALKGNLKYDIDRKQIDKISSDKTCAILVAVGDKMIGSIGISGKLRNSLAKANINIRAISQGSSERKLILLAK